ncbi:hypothetical protein GCM10007879_02770 [Maritalea porphyrae]|uniref:Uncharacterized protein n=1 Tax=Maritalea porphyrae TaxID=880732 RepID=A0ABQ5UN76_9HYPH|nr:hypothetical protein GCM10007879_02770 [Maritalea porphyrae]
MKAPFTHVNPKANKGFKQPNLGKQSQPQFTNKLPKKAQPKLPTQQSLAEFLKKN